MSCTKIGKVTIRAYIITIGFNYTITNAISFELMVRFILLFFSFSFFLQTEFSLLVDYHKPKHTLKMCDCCLNCQGHSNGSNFNLMFAWMVSSEQLKL